MARQAGLGKSLHEVLESLQPADSWPEGPRLAREQLEQELDQLIEDVHALRERVQQLAAEAAHSSKSSHAGGKHHTKQGKHKNKKKNKKKKEDPFALCAPQVDQCKTTVTVLAGNAAQILCCDAFATCDATQFFLCLLTTPS